MQPQLSGLAFALHPAPCLLACAVLPRPTFRLNLIGLNLDEIGLNLDYNLDLDYIYAGLRIPAGLIATDSKDWDKLSRMLNACWQALGDAAHSQDAEAVTFLSKQCEGARPCMASVRCNLQPVYGACCIQHQAGGHAS